ncbi:MAG: glyoxylase-like metal-dependent hydrolase (beta-lactamase superfamily II) [Bacteroidia bacterium]|jgi:glyoxylase-like metal-dependent hydrolase (beta-lactamase superfamily II)
MRLKAIHTGNFKLDGGAMFGVVPKMIWNKYNEADANNLCNWAMRCLLVEDGNRLILIDTGIGDKQSEKFFGYYFLNGEHSLKKSLNAEGVDFKDITDVFLTHLHFDHCGGAIVFNPSKQRYEPAFPNATYWSHKDHWQHAIKPNPREKASFISENILPIQESGQLKFIGDDLRFTNNIDVILANGHTEKMMCPKIKVGDKTLVFCADMIPSAAHVPPHYAMGYDIRPLIRMEENEAFLKEAVANDYTLFYEHDLNNEAGKVFKTDRGFKASVVGSLVEFLKG